MGMSSLGAAALVLGCVGSPFIIMAVEGVINFIAARADEAHRSGQ